MRRLALLFMALFIFWGCTNDNSDRKANYNPDPKVGAKATDFLFRDIDEKPFRLSEHKGHVVLLYFWRMKCRECTDAMDPLELLYRKYKDRGLVVVTVGADTMHSAPIEDVRDFLSRHGISSVTLRDDQGFVSEAYNVLKAPMAFIIDKDGTIVSIKEGKTDWMSHENTSLMESLTK
ncbi:MAG: TlpA family protein disulfide reductase [Deltaproteobacteria bacterium]|nr:TlpA family protein disulfide reductase [Deltaproteobacteria bacterium]